MVLVVDSLKQKLLGAVIMRDLSLNGYVSSLYKKAVLARLSNVLSCQQKKI